MTRRRRYLLAGALALPAAALFVVWLGIVDVSARTGHWRITAWFLHWAMRSSVETAARGIQAPDLDNPDWLAPAAHHFERGCAVCHGSPAEPRPPAPLAMLPAPPDLAAVAGQWTDEELFVIVRDGVRYTGMPSWPAAGRSDEVWPIVALLRRLPGMSASEYRNLLGPENTVGEAITASCEDCHKEGAPRPGSPVPVLDGQSEAYLLESLDAYARGDRPSGFMAVAISGMTSRELSDAARSFAARPPGMSRSGRRGHAGDEAAATLAAFGNAERKIAACDACHDGRNDRYPLLHGQPVGYLAAQLRLFRDGSRGGGLYAGLMARAARNLSDEDIVLLARHYGAGEQNGASQ